MMDPKRLWAKSVPNGMPIKESMYLLRHLQEVHKAAQQVVEATGRDQLAALGLDVNLHFDRFRRCVLLAAAVHDLGKANDHFQGMICRIHARKDKPQAVRHEWISLLILQQLRTWLRPAVEAEVDLDIVEWAVTGHHPSHSHSSPPRSAPGGSGVEIRLRLDEPDFTACLDWLGEAFGISTPAPRLTAMVKPISGSKAIFEEFRLWFRNAQQLWEKSIRRSDDAKLLAAVKNCLIAADIAGSALPKQEGSTPTDIWEWIPKSFLAKPTPADLKSIVEKRLKNNELRSFQQAVAASKAPVTYVKAGCGSGKTLAAYKWAEVNHPGRRLYFCYPRREPPPKASRTICWNRMSMRTCSIQDGVSTSK